MVRFISLFLTLSLALYIFFDGKKRGRPYLGGLWAVSSLVLPFVPLVYFLFRSRLMAPAGAAGKQAGYFCSRCGKMSKQSNLCSLCGNTLSFES